VKILVVEDDKKLGGFLRKGLEAQGFVVDFCDNPWTVGYNGTNPFAQVTNSNYGGNPCVLQFSRGTANLADSTITTANGINATGNAGYIEFYIKTANLITNTGWAMQLNAGSGFVTRTNDLTGSVHNWQLYHYNLQSAELVSNLLLRFEFAGGGNTNKIYLDQISVVGTTGGGSCTTTAPPMTEFTGGKFRRFPPARP